jgi:hypothetical protein
VSRNGAAPRPVPRRLARARLRAAPAEVVAVLLVVLEGAGALEAELRAFRARVVLTQLEGRLAPGAVD